MSCDYAPEVNIPAACVFRSFLLGIYTHVASTNAAAAAATDDVDDTVCAY